MDKELHDLGEAEATKSAPPLTHRDGVGILCLVTFCILFQIFDYNQSDAERKELAALVKDRQSTDVACGGVPFDLADRRRSH